MKRITSIILVLSILLISTVTFASGIDTGDIQETIDNISKGIDDITSGINNLVATVSSVLKDIDDHWGKEYIESLVDKGIIDGYPDGTYRPNDPIGRDAFLKLAVVGMGYNLGNAQGYWAQNYIDKAIELNLITSNEFSKYNASIKREEMASVIVNAILMAENKANSNLLTHIQADVGDYNKISDKYKESVLNSYAFGVIKGYGGKFHPQDTATRAEAATIIMRFLDESIRAPYEDDKDIPTIELTDVSDRSTTFKVYPKAGAEEMIGVAEVLKETVGLNGTYGDLIYSPDEKAIAIQYYPSKDKYELDTIERLMEVDLSVSIYVSNWGDEKISPYRLAIRDEKDIKEYHLESVTNIFDELFDNESDDVMDIFIKHLNRNEKYNSIDMVVEEFNFNDRTVYFYDNNASGFGIRVSLKK